MSAMFDFISGKKQGKVAELEASLEHTAGYLGVEIEGNAKLRAEIDRLRAELEDACKVFDHYDLPEHAFHYRRRLRVNEQLTAEKK